MCVFILLWLIPFIIVFYLGRHINKKVEEQYKITFDVAVFYAMFGIAGLSAMLLMFIVEDEYRSKYLTNIITYLKNKYEN